MSDTKPPRPVSSDGEIDRFLAELEQAPPTDGARRGRLLFAMDATASRQSTWDRACQLQGDMFTRTRGLGQLDIQLCFYRGYDEFRVSPWHDNPSDLVRATSVVRCLGGHTQIERVLRHALAEHRRQPIQALVFIGDCIEESVDDLCRLAGELGLLGVPIFLFQEGDDIVALRGFKQMARLSHGTHVHFDSDSPEQLSRLLNAVAVYAAGGLKALKAMSRSDRRLEQLTRQLEAPPR